ncbi:PREDICTED: F-box/LRR-repeat protein 13-like [Camelina sativa]|uniref:F-box/LRR-repeat protein 13-like n=1 Tax=Camelina sativa TaxID=90675 RepID=A0ABM0TQF8_CAMSA|nr:PREDICTED: F-box/LRR-repeat protein 13-like [Camelina sativa]
MDEAEEVRVGAKQSGEVDRISHLPDSLLCQVLLFLPTKDVVKSSVLSRRWRDLWKCVPRLDLYGFDFHEEGCYTESGMENCVSFVDRFLSFVDRFLGLHSESCLESVRFSFLGDGNREPDNALIWRWMNTVLDMKVKHIEYSEDARESDESQIPPAIYTCLTLVSLELCGVTMSSPEFVSLPSLRVLDLIYVIFPDDLALETLISGCTALETLNIARSAASAYDKLLVLRVCSQSLLSFTYCQDKEEDFMVDRSVVIDAPRLKFLKLDSHRTASFIIKNSGSLVKVDIDIVFSLSGGSNFDPADLPKRNMIRNFLGSIYLVKDVIISSRTLEVFYDYSRCEPLPLFCNLSSLNVFFAHDSWEMLPNFLHSCPNLKSLVVDLPIYPDPGRIYMIPGPRCVLSSLEYVRIMRPLNGEELETKLVSYILENSPILKKLTLILSAGCGFYRKKGKSVILKELIAIPRLSTSCRVIVSIWEI